MAGGRPACSQPGRRVVGRRWAAPPGHDPARRGVQARPWARIETLRANGVPEAGGKRRGPPPQTRGWRPYGARPAPAGLRGGTRGGLRAARRRRDEAWRRGKSRGRHGKNFSRAGLGGPGQRTRPGAGLGQRPPAAAGGSGRKEKPCWGSARRGGGEGPERAARPLARPRLVHPAGWPVAFSAGSAARRCAPRSAGGWRTAPSRPGGC